MICRICGNDKGNRKHFIKERIINQGTTFEYLECSKCGALMLNENIEDFSQWYPKSYNPFRKIEDNTNRWLKIYRKLLVEILIRLKNPELFQRFLSINNLDILLKRLYGSNISKKDKILDIGCASGYWLDWMYEMGWKRITGVDLFYPDIDGERKWEFIKGDIFVIKEKYDCIILNHSFEHMEEPLNVLKHIRKLLQKNGICIISVPMMGGEAWKMFGTDFCQIDAPRHIFLYTEKSMKYLCEKAGLSIERILYDSNEKVFSLSAAYKKYTKSHDELMRNDYATKRMKIKYKQLAIESNSDHNGDQAIFYIKLKKGV
ncbi:MAG: class I SAM-dependent methyltransferase [Anaerocolumna sp.]